MIGEIGNMLSSTCSHTENVSDSFVSFGELQGHVMTPCGQISASRNGDPPPVRPKRPRVYWRHAHMWKHSARGARTHEDVWNLHTGVLQVCRTTHHNNSSSNHTEQHATTHGDRQTETEKKDKRRQDERPEEARRETRDEKTEDKRREGKRREETIKRDTMCYVCGCVFLLFLVQKHQTLEEFRIFKNYHFRP